jgi:hypothetical protein
VWAESFKSGHVPREHQPVVIVNMFGERIACTIRTTHKRHYGKSAKALAEVLVAPLNYLAVPLATRTEK